MRGLLVTLAFAALAASAGSQSSADLRAEQAYREILSRFDTQSLERHMKTIGAFGSRLAGSAGERQTLEYLEAEFRRLGLLNIRREPFRITIPDPNAQGRLRFQGRELIVHPLWPNLVRTSTCDVAGTLVFGGNGSLEALRGLDLKGRLVVLAADSGSHWRTAFKLGARAVLFLDSDHLTRFEAEAKFSSAPLDAPRFLVLRQDADALMAAARKGTYANLSCRQDWIVRDTYNLIGDLPGTSPDWNEQQVVFAAPVDAMSAVPALAPGASGIASASALLELARQISRSPGRRPSSFAAISSQGLGLQGWREYAERRIAEGGKSFLHVTLDLNDGNEVLGAFGRGWFYEYRNESLDVIRGVTRSLREHANRLAPLLGRSQGKHILLDAANDSDGRSWRNAIYGKYASGCEPLLMAGMNAITLSTAENHRPKVDTPLDTLSNLNTARIEHQARVFSCLAWHLLHDTDHRSELSAHKVPVDVRAAGRWSLIGGFSTVEGQVVQFDPNRSFVADLPVPGALAVAEHPQKSLAGVRATLVQQVSDPDARFRFIGMAPRSAYFHLEARELKLSAYGIEPITGRIGIAPNDGSMGFAYERIFELITTYRSLPLVVFDAVPTNLFGLVDPQELKPLGAFRVMDPVSDAAPRNFSLALPAADLRLNSNQEDAAVLFMEAGAQFKLLMGSSTGEWRLLLTGASPKVPEGEGYATPEPGGPPFDVSRLAALDLTRLNDSRLQRFASYRILNPSLNQLEERAVQAAERANQARRIRDWPASEREFRAAWSLALRAHPQIQGTVNDVVAGVVFYLILLVPFSYFAERLLFARRNLGSQLLISGAIFIGSFLVLRTVHPAFEIVTNPGMIFVAFVMGALSLLVMTFIVGKFESSLKEVLAKRTGLGHLDVGRMSVAMAAFHLGIANMRRRRARTILTTLTLVTMTFIVLSFTSFVPELKLAESPAGRAAAYNGLLVRNSGLEPLMATSYHAIQNEFSGRAEVARRVWFYGADLVDHGFLAVRHKSAFADVRAVAGFDPEESEVTALPSAFVPGSRWFRKGDRNVAILSRELAKKLGLTESTAVGKLIEFGGVPRKIVGVLDDSRFIQLADLDGEPLLPADFSLSRRFQARTSSATKAFRKFTRIDPAACLLLPATDVLELGGELRSIGVRLGEADVRSALASLMPRLRMNLYAGVPGKNGQEVVQFSVLQSAKSAGIGLVLVQMLIASVFVLNTMVASVYERKREIGIFSSIGLAPNHIAILFFAESAVYGVLGAVVGYLAAQATARLVTVAGWAPNLYLNFSATSAVLAAGIVMAVVLLSTLYPARVAERLAAPAYERDDFGVPEGDRWTILLPFRVGAHEAEPLLRFFLEWLRGHEEYAVGEFVAQDPEFFERDGRPSLSCRIWLSPFDLGVSQQIHLVATNSALENTAELELILERTSGEPRNWRRLNSRFLTAIRRHFLAWRTRAPE